MEDEALVGQIRRGNREAFRVLVLRYQRPLFRFLGLLGFDGAACEDLAQQTFLSAFRALADFDPGRARFSTWLFTIAKRHASHERERAHRRHETPATEATDALSRSPAPDPAEAAVLAQRLRTLDAALGSLPQELRSTFLLSQIKELSLGEVAAVENCPIGTVKSRIHRARERLRLALAPRETS
jgi:RNA polymerase sigma-70 factor (ECF subfamily)